MLAVMSFTLFFVADVKCGLYVMNKNNRANATHGPNPFKKMFQDRTKAMLDWRGPGPGRGPVLTLTLVIILWCLLFAVWKENTTSASTQVTILCV